MKNTHIEHTQTPETELTPREAYLAANPNASAVQSALLTEYHTRRTRLRAGLSSILFQFVDKVEEARQIGIVLVELAEALPGRKITRDFYEQMRGVFTDARGQCDSFEMLEWYQRMARSNPEPIQEFQTAMKWHTPLLLASGEPEFQLAIEPAVKERVPPKDELGQLRSWLDNPAVVSVWQQLKLNPRYYQDGHMRPDLRERMAEEFRELINMVDELKKELGL
jgi:hypothetical protein